MHLYVYIIHTYMCMSLYLSVCLSVCLFTYVCMCTYVYVCVCAYVSRADCDEEGNKAMCGKVGVRGYPTLKIYPVSLHKTSTKTPYTIP